MSSAIAADPHSDLGHAADPHDTHGHDGHDAHGHADTPAVEQSVAARSRLTVREFAGGLALLGFILTLIAGMCLAMAAGWAVCIAAEQALLLQWQQHVPGCQPQLLPLPKWL